MTKEKKEKKSFTLSTDDDGKVYMNLANTVTIVRFFFKDHLGFSKKTGEYYFSESDFYEEYTLDPNSEEEIKLMKKKLKGVMAGVCVIGEDTYTNFQYHIQNETPLKTIEKDIVRDAVQYVCRENEEEEEERKTTRT